MIFQFVLIVAILIVIITLVVKIAIKITPLFLTSNFVIGCLSKSLQKYRLKHDLIKMIHDELLLSSCKIGNLPLVKLLINDNMNPDYDYALTWSAECGRLSVVKYLIEKGYDVNADDGFALIYSAQRGHLSVVKLLVENGADINAIGNHPFGWRVITRNLNNLNIVKYLIENGFRPNVNDNHLLKWSVENNHLELVESLAKLYLEHDIVIPGSIITTEVNDVNKLLINYVGSDKYDLFDKSIASTIVIRKSARKN